MTPPRVRSRPARVVTVCVSGREPKKLRQNESRIDLLVQVARALKRRPDWAPLDALLFPAGYFRCSDWFGPLSSEQRLEALELDDPGGTCVAQAKRLRRVFPGLVIVAGFDSKRWRGWRGDMMMAAFNAVGGVGIARMTYPLRGDRMLVFDHDFDDPARTVSLPNGERALLSVCYDAFALGELRAGNAGKRGNLSHLGLYDDHWRKLQPGEAGELLQRSWQQVCAAKPTVSLIGIHTFKQPGAELFWQRHGIATASAALDGALAVGATHWTEQMPDSIHANPLAASGVPLKHLAQGAHRTAREHRALDGFEVALRDDLSVRALLRLYEPAEA